MGNCKTCTNKSSEEITNTTKSNCGSCSSEENDTCQGLQGIKGDEGDKGEPGNSILCGVGTPAEGLGFPKDLYIDTESGDLYEKDDMCVWVLKGNIKGPAGPGLIGEDGPPTEDGDYCGQVYVDLLTGDQYTWNCDTNTWDLSAGNGLKGPQGDKGDKGDTGDTGPADTFEAWNSLDISTNSWSGAVDYTKSESGLTILRGEISKSLDSAQNDYLIGTLPAGYRPDQKSKFLISFSYSTGTITSFGNSRVFEAHVDTNGDVTLSQIVIAGTTTVTYDLSSIVFLAEQ